VPDAGATPIRRSAIVRADSARAFDLFTRGMGTWWPLDAYSRAVNEFADDRVRAERLEFEPRLGGSIEEHLSDGRVVGWGEVIAWEPPNRVTIAWQPHSLPETPTELAATFTQQADGTLVEVEHRGWERLSPAFRDAMYEIYVRGWFTTFDLFVNAAGGLAG
jgi:uncharacterized protein YndB with AHSA1/START domain